jgi:predicted nucleic-acid-binding protein
MLVADTNILLRLVLDDDPVHKEKVRAQIRSLEKKGEHLLLTQVVLQECLWVLESQIGLQRQEIALMLEALLSMDVFQVESPGRLRRALHFYERYRVDFVDAYIAGASEESGHSGVLSFDKDIGKMGVKWVRP